MPEEANGLKPVAFSFTEPDNINGKTAVRLASAGMVTASVQFLSTGGDNNLHSHSAEDEVFLILGGRVRFYGKDHEIVAELGQGEGIVIPRRFPYWFESTSDELLTIYKVGAQDPRYKNERLNYEGLTSQQIARGDNHPLIGRVPTESERI